MKEITQRIRWFNKVDFDIFNPVCDVCDEPIIEFPCAVRGSYALCRKCQSKAGIKEGHTEYFETMAYNLDIEPRQIGTNCGGR